MRFLHYSIVLLFLFSSCEKKEVIDTKAEGDKVMETSRNWAKSKSSEEMLSYWAEDAVFKAPDQPILRGKEQIKKMLESTSSIPGFEVNWEPKEVFVAKSGDLAYLIEDIYFASNDSLGNQLKSFGKAITIWKKQEDGSWKNVVDTYSPDPSLTSIN